MQKSEKRHQKKDRNYALYTREPVDDKGSECLSDISPFIEIRVIFKLKKVNKKSP